MSTVEEDCGSIGTRCIRPHGEENVEKYSDEWTRELMVVVARSDNEDDFSDTDEAEAEKPQKKLSKAIDHDILDPFGKEEAFEDEENAEENCSFPCGFDLDKSNEKLWSDEFTKFHEQYAPNVMLFGISTLATRSMMTDASKSSDSTATDDTASTLIKRVASKDSREEVSLNSALNGRMSISEVEDAHERAKQSLEILSSICTFLMKMGDFEEALLSFQQILESKRMKYGARAHASVGAALHNVAAVHLRSEQFRRALIVSTEALYVRRKALGNDHVDVAQTLLQLGTIQISMKDYGGALASLQEALKIRRSASSKLLDSRQTDARNKNLRQIGDTLSRLGLLHFETEEYLSAAAAFEDALLTYRSCLSQESCPHTVIAETLINLGSVRCKRKQYSEAIVAFDEAVMIQKMEYGSYHPTVLNTIDSLVYSYSKSGSHEVGLNIYTQLIKGIKKNIKSLSRCANDNGDHKKQEFWLVCSRILHKMSILNEKLGNLPSAIDCTRQALEMQRYVYHNDCASSDSDEEHPNIVATKRTLMRLLANQRTQQNESEKIGIRGSQSPRSVTAVSDTSSSHSNGKSKKDRFHRMPKLLRLPAHFGSLT